MKVGTTVWFSAAHRLLRHKGKCHHLHGHNWRVDIEVEGTVEQDDVVVDFGALKELVLQYDHKALLNENDTDIIRVCRELDLPYETFPHDPTCETIASTIARQILHRFPNVCQVTVTVWESHHNFARCHICRSNYTTTD